MKTVLYSTTLRRILASYAALTRLTRLTLKLGVLAAAISGAMCFLFAVSITLNNPELVGSALRESIRLHRWPLRIVDGR